MMTESAASMQMAAMQAVYRCFDSGGRLLYVGVTGNLGRRLADHAQKIWFLEVRGITLDWYQSETEARDAERRIIHIEQPKYNIVHKTGTLRSVRRSRASRIPPAAPRPSLVDVSRSANPCRARMRELLAGAPQTGATPHGLLACLTEENLDVARSTLQRWLRHEVKAGRAMQIGYARYISVQGVV